ncbi:MAG: hypothetical protein ACREYB_00745 [Casimicrobiaceae bacterium]
MHNATYDVDLDAEDAVAANRPRDAATPDAAPPPSPAPDRLHQTARTRRSFTLGDIAAAIQTAGAIARQAYARYRARGQARAVYNLLRDLDDRTLRDLGFDRSAIRFVAAELTREAEYTCARAPRTIEQSSERDPRLGL